jgi:hypothetical protein
MNEREDELFYKIKKNKYISKNRESVKKIDIKNDEI